MTRRGKAGSSPGMSTHAAPGGTDQRELAAGASDFPVSDGEQVEVEDFLPLAILPSERRGVGRPKGAANIRTNTTFQAAISRYGDPLIATIAWGNMDTKDLIRQLREIASDCGLKLGATVMDVVRFQEECRRNAMPFGHAKRAATDEKGDVVLPLIGIGRVDQLNVTAGGRSIEDELAARQAAAKTVDIQPVSDSAAAKSHGQKSHGEGKADE